MAPFKAPEHWLAASDSVSVAPGFSVRVGSGRICNVTSGVFGREAFLMSPDDTAAAGGGAGDTPPALTKEQQALFDSTLGKRLGEERARAAQDVEAAKAEQTKLAKEHADAVAELAKIREERELEGKTAAEKDKINADKAARAIERERLEADAKLKEAQGRAEQSVAKLRDRDISAALGSGLDSSKVLPEARAKAIAALKFEAKVELDDDGNVTSVTYGGRSHKSAAEAAVEFLKDNPFFASNGGASGNGTRPPNASGLPPGKTLYDLPQDDLLARGARR